MIPMTVLSFVCFTGCNQPTEAQAQAAVSGSRSTMTAASSAPADVAAAIAMVSAGDTVQIPRSSSSVIWDCTEAEISYEQYGGCRVVNRYNHVIMNSSFVFTGVHGRHSTGRARSGRHTETY
jgi:hypothetical protein